VDVRHTSKLRILLTGWFIILSWLQPVDHCGFQKDKVVFEVELRRFIFCWRMAVALEKEIPLPGCNFKN
jgi:hypothetical protein